MALNRRRLFGWAGLVTGAVLVILLWVSVVLVAARPELRFIADLTPNHSATVTAPTVQLIDQLEQLGARVEIAKFYDDPFRQRRPSRRDRAILSIHDKIRSLTDDLLRQYNALGGDRLRVIDCNPRTFPERHRQWRDTVGPKRGNHVLVIAVHRLGADGKDSIRSEELSIDQELATWDFGPMANVPGGSSRLPQLENYLGEEAITSAIKTLLEGGTPTVYLIDGHRGKIAGARRGPLEVHNFASSLQDHGFKVDKINLGDEAIPAAATVLACFEPEVDFRQEECDKLLAFLRRGGRVFLNVTYHPLFSVKLEKLLEPLGLRLGTGLVAQVWRDPSRYATLEITKMNSNHAITRGLVEARRVIGLREAVAITSTEPRPDGVAVDTTFLKTADSCWEVQRLANGPPAPPGGQRALRLALRRRPRHRGLDRQAPGQTSAGQRGDAPQHHGRRGFAVGLRSQLFRVVGGTSGDGVHPQERCEAGHDRPRDQRGCQTRPAHERTLAAGGVDPTVFLGPRIGGQLAPEANLMGWKVNVAMGIAVLGIGGYQWFKEPPVTSEPGQSVMTVKLMPAGLSIWQARQVKIQRGALEPMILTLDHAKQRYRITDPVRDVASFATLQSVFRIYDMAELLAAWTDEELAAEPKYLASTKLDQPAATVEVRFADETLMIEIGAEAWNVGEVFIRVRGKIYRGPRTLLSSIQHNPDDLREKAIFSDLAIGAMRKVRLQRRIDGEMVVDAVARLPEVGFRIVEPKNLRADMDQVEKLVLAIGGLRVARFVSGGAPIDPSALSHDFILEIEGEFGQETLTVMDLSKADSGGRERYLARLEQRGIMFELRPDGLADVHRHAGLLRARHLIPYSQKYVQRIELQAHGGKKMVLVRGGGAGFRMLEPIESPTASTPASELLFAISHLEAQKFLDEIPPSAGLGDDDEFFTLRVGTSREARNLTTVRLGTTALGGLVHARRADEATGVMLAANGIAKLRRSWLEFVSPVICQVTGSAFFVAAAPPGREESLHAKLEGEWQHQAGAKVQVRDLKWLVGAIRKFRTDRVLAPEVIPAAAKGVRIVLYGGQTRASGTLIAFDLFPFEESAADGQIEKSTIVRVGDRGVVYRVDDPRLRRLYDSWTR